MPMSRVLFWMLAWLATAAQAQAPSAARSPAGDGREGSPAVDTLVAQPVIDDAEVSSRIIGEVRPDGEKFLVRIANMGTDAASAAVTWDVGRYTGFRPAEGESLARFQRGPAPTPEGSAVQMRRNEIGIWIDSDHPRPKLGLLLPVCPAYWWWDVKTAPRPFVDATRELAMAFDMQVPTADRAGGSEVYVCAYFLLRDQKTGRHFWLGASLFDLRGAAKFPDLVHFDDWEGGTNLPILFTALNDHSAWLHPGPGSQCFQDQPFAGYRHFEFRVGSAELRTAVQAMKRRWPKLAEMSEEPSDYQLTHFNINPEVYAPQGSRGRLGLALRDIRVELKGRDER